MSGKAYELALREFASDYGQVAVLTNCCSNLSSKCYEKNDTFAVEV